MTPFGAYLRKLRNKNNVSQKYFAEQFGVSPSYLSLLERGKKGKPPKRLKTFIINYFSLTQTETVELDVAAKVSECHITIPPNVKPDVYRAAHLFTKRAKELSNKDLSSLISLLSSSGQKEDQDAVDYRD